jgi:3-oxoacyl-[acyl-carrier protein] reductase
VAEAIRSAGGVAETAQVDALDGRSVDAHADAVAAAAGSMLGRVATFEDVGDVAAFVASDRARTMTAATVNISAGALVD